MEAINNRYEFVMLFDVENGNPNGDPDAGNMPRVDAESGLGIVTDVCLKRKIRNYVQLVKEGEPGYDILIRTDKALNTKFAEAYAAKGLKSDAKGSIPAARAYMCERYFDVRAFGAVMSTAKETKTPCGIVRGPVQLNFARSLDPAWPQEITITRQAVTKDSDRDRKETEMGKKNIVPYALYRGEGYVSANLARRDTGFSEDDLELLFTAIVNMFEEDHSAARGKMCMRRLFVFKHESVLGNAPSHVLFEKIAVSKRPGVEYPRAFSDYEVTVDSAMPEGVRLIERL